jgi:raffinose/stachyose/melibiose transport system substrate-binding protein
MATDESGHEYMVNEANMVPAFTNVELKPKTPLSAATTDWLAKEDGAYTWLQNDMPDGFGMGTLGPIYGLYASDGLDKAQFIDQVKRAIESIE